MSSLFTFDNYGNTSFSVPAPIFFPFKTAVSVVKDDLQNISWL